MMLFKTAARSSSVGLVATGLSSIAAYSQLSVRSICVCGGTHGLDSSRRHNKQRPDMRGKGSPVRVLLFRTCSMRADIVFKKGYIVVQYEAIDDVEAE